MASPDPEGMSLLGKVVAAGAAIIGPVWIARNWLESRFGKKMDRDDFKEFLIRFDKHCDNDREVQAKLFDKVDEVKSLLIRGNGGSHSRFD